MQRVGIVVHPTRSIDDALETIESWTAARDVELVQVQTGIADRMLAPPGDVGVCDLIVAIGGDGTVLTALHAAAKTRTPVLGVACGSLGALSTVSPAELRAGLDSFAAGDWLPVQLPALTVATAESQTTSAINDVVLVRRGSAQLIVEVSVGDGLYVRLAGDGVVVATELGSSAYSMAAGGPLLLAGANGFVCTPLAMHGGSAPPLVIPADRELTLVVDPGHGGFDLEVDGHAVESTARRFEVRMRDGYATLVGLGPPGDWLARLRQRGLITDSPRVLARAARAAPAAHRVER